MPRPTPAPVVSDKLQLYEKPVATNPSVKRKGATVPYTSLNGHMLSYVSKEGKLALRLPPDQREVFLKNTTPNGAKPMAWFKPNTSKFRLRCSPLRGS
jgi:hypothetical protein